jgi:hypothetical protein
MLSDHAQPPCPECDDLRDQAKLLDRRGFIRRVGGQAAGLVALGGAAAAPLVRADEPDAKADDIDAKPAEALIRELYATLSAEQKRELVMPWDHGTTKDGKGIATRLRMYNTPILGKRIGESYTPAQRELNRRILRSICSDDDGYRRICRGGDFDTGGGFDGCGAAIFGEPADGKKFAWVFSGHHLTVRCDGNSEEGAGFGGPMFYGHSPDGYSEKNIFWYQTKSVLSVFEALTEEQRRKAVIRGTPGEGAGSIQFRPKEQAPGIVFADLNKEQHALIERVMRDILSPYRKEDADEVMDIVKVNGGLEQMHLAFYEDMRMNDQKPWHFWRLEGPGFVWNYRILPHVHTYVNVSSKV